jgi:GH15 family glucan-1,4-alpha-glucosidase
MNQFIEKLRSLENEISKEKGKFSLFALFLREDAADKWDLVVSAPWLMENQKEALDYLAKQLRDHLDDQELLSLSRIIFIDEGDPRSEAICQAIGRAIRIEHGIAEVKDSIFFGLEIKHAFIITSAPCNRAA